MKQICEMEECTICLINLNYNVAILSCGHKYHYSCIQDWIKVKNKNICPICDNYFTIITIINQQIYDNDTVYQNSENNTTYQSHVNLIPTTPHDNHINNHMNNHMNNHINNHPNRENSDKISCLCCNIL